MVTIINWNINSINVRITQLKELINNLAADIVLLQEIKCTKENFPYTELEDQGYNIVISGQKTYNGVAILSKSTIEDVRFNLPNINNNEARYIDAFTIVEDIPLRIASVYVPNGSEIGSVKFQQKLNFFEKLHVHLKNLRKQEENIVIAGDFNAAPSNIDVYNSKHLDGKIGFHPDERMWFRKLLNTGYLDSYRIVNPDTHEYSWWDYRKSGWQQNKGMRIDHILLSPQVMDIVENVTIFSKARTWIKPSDHAPVVCKLK